MGIGVYIHIPFCKQKCLYCDFISYANKENLQKRYINALKKEIENWAKSNKEINIDTIYIGGGTPSYIDSKYIKEILEKLIKTDNKNWAQTTIEVNPGTVTEEKLLDYKNSKINRLSIGLQSSKDSILLNIGRIHTYEDFLKTYSLARHFGFKNINVDLMIGLPGQKIEDIKETLEKLMNLKPIPPEHISVYSLIVEENTPMQKLIQENKMILPDEEQERRMYWYVKDFLELNGYEHYEISNFAKPGFRSKHNIDCWEQKEYIGFGVAAHSYLENKRFCNISDLEKYIKNIEKGDFKANIIIEEIQNKTEQMKEYMVIGLRKIEGISIQAFENKFNENPIILFKNELNKLKNQELIIVDGDYIKLSNKGLDLANIAWEEFL